MKCPDCSSGLEETDYRGLRLDECPRCRGRWFDRDELRQAKDRTDDDLRWLDFDPFGQEAGRFAIRSERDLCPRCETPMASLTYETSRVVIDKCEQCQGIWLNHGEFEKIIKYLYKIVSSKKAADYVKEAQTQFVEVFTGPEGTISEIRDFLAVLTLLRLRIAVEQPGIADAADTIYRYSPFK